MFSLQKMHLFISLCFFHAACSVCYTQETTVVHPELFVSTCIHKASGFQHAVDCLYIYAEQLGQQLQHKCCRLLISVLKGMLLIYILQGHTQSSDFKMLATSQESLGHKGKSLAQIFSLPANVLKGKAVRWMLQKGGIFLGKHNNLRISDTRDSFYIIFFFYYFMISILLRKRSFSDST